ncbi:DnaB helicase C-terminal domain-containing protein [Salirhabdus sp. Marseille-P4669]|nr:DnaB helicase C-terminal domain-containing protein [Salirhabdus sp. Marseille-P4669]
MKETGQTEKMEVIVSKHRNGAAGAVYLEFV